MAKNYFIHHHRAFFLIILPVLFIFTACTQETQTRQEPMNGQLNGAPQDEPINISPTDAPNIAQHEWPFEFEPNMRFSLWAEDVPGARVLSQKDATGNRWLSRTNEGIISLISINRQTGEVTRVSDVLTGLNRPHGLAIDPEDGLTLYFAESDQVSRVEIYTDASPEVLVELPEGGRHFTRTLHFGPDGRLYVSIGSSCDVCVEGDERRAAIYSMNKDGTDFRPYATGLRNSVFMATHPVTGEVWTTEMGRDNLGDDLPPDEINILQEGENYGWPYCYGNRVRDETFEPETEFNCEETIGSHIDLQAHSAPLGLDFFPEEGWPEEYWHDLLVAYHGSWNRTVPTGYKLVRFDLTNEGQYQNRQDFLTGWMNEQGQIIGRPVDVVIDVGGEMYITDDEAGTIYKITYQPQE